MRKQFEEAMLAGQMIANDLILVYTGFMKLIKQVSYLVGEGVVRCVKSPIKTILFIICLLIGVNI